MRNPGPDPRDPSFDAFRGLALLGVLALHLSGNALSRLPEASPAHLATALLNAAFGFVVPAFLFLSALLTVRAILRPGWNPVRRFPARLASILGPYLVWSLAYVWLRVKTGELGPADLTPARWVFWLAYGKASFHLYYLLVAAQLTVLLPLLAPLWRRRPGLPLTLAAALAVQLAAWSFNHFFWRFPFPATLLTAYCLPVALGAALGARPEDPTRFAARAAPLAALAALLGGAGLLWQVARLQQHQFVSTFAFDAFSWPFAAGMSLVLLAVSARLSAGAAAPLATLGRVSMPVYLLHPAVLMLARSAGAVPRTVNLPSQALLFTLALAVPLAAALALKGTAAARLLFGRG